MMIAHGPETVSNSEPQRLLYTLHFFSNLQDFDNASSSIFIVFSQLQTRILLLSISKKQSPKNDTRTYLNVQ